MFKQNACYIFKQYGVFPGNTKTRRLASHIGYRDARSGFLQALLSLVFIFSLFTVRGQEIQPPDPPRFSHTSGFYQEELTLTLTTGVSGADIYYTLDGSEPDPEGLEGTTYRYKNYWPQNPYSTPGEFLTGAYHTHLYSEPIHIVDRSDQPDSLTRKASSFDSNYYFPNNPVFKGTIVRAISVLEDGEASPVATQVFFVHPEARMRFHLPVISIAINEDHLFDYYDGIYTPGIDFDQWRQNNPAPHVDGSRPANYHRRGEEWEYPAHLTYFDTHSAIPDLSQDVGIRIHGAWTRSFPMKSIRVYARSAYGESTLDYPFFPDYPYDSFKRIILRNSGNDWATTMFRDAAIQKVVGPLNIETQAYQPALLFINGEYWGIHNIRERYDKHYLARVYGVEGDEIDYLTANSEPEEGGTIHYWVTRQYIQDNDMESDEHFDHVATRIDLENFMDYQIANIYAANNDWPGNNIDYWRKRTPDFEPDSPPGHDGRWRWLAYDMDFGFGLVGGYHHNTLAFATQAGNTDWPNPDWATFLLRNLLRNEGFRTDFINRFADLLNTRFTTDTVLSLINEYKAQLDPEMNAHIARWKQPGNPGTWNHHVNIMREFAERRPGWQRQHIRQYFDLGEYSLVEVKVSGPAHGHVKINTIDIRFDDQGPGGQSQAWSGTYFRGVPIRVEAIPAEGYAFSHWEGVQGGDSAAIHRDPGELTRITAHFIPKITEILIHYWYFDTNIPNDQPLESIQATFSSAENAWLGFQSAMEGYPFDEESPYWRKASLERRNAPTPINYHARGNGHLEYDESVMRGIQVKQPFTGDGGENLLVFHLPTTGFRDVVFRFAARDEGAAEAILPDYSTQGGDHEWTTAGLPVATYDLSGGYRLFEVDFTGMETVDDNEAFKIRIRFTGSEMELDEGNRVSFNNFSLEGWPLHTENLSPVVIQRLPLQEVVEEGTEWIIRLDEVFSDPDGDRLEFSAVSASPDHVQASLNDNILTLSPLKRGDATIYISVSDGVNEKVESEFRVMVYPKAFTFGAGDFSFESWSAGAPDHTYPDHMLFLQGNQADPGIDTPLLSPYFVPHDDYHEDDVHQTGFPYALTRRTRISALGDQGISFINTGRERDLGGALLALRTSGLSNLQLEWTAATILQNDRVYGIRIQYREGTTGSFSDVMVHGEPIEYIVGSDGDVRDFGPMGLPADLLDKEYIQLLWRYYHLEGNSGPRPELRLGNIGIGPSVGVQGPSLHEARIFASGKNIVVGMPGLGPGNASVFNLIGQKLHSEHLPGHGTFRLGIQLPQGFFIVRLETGSGATSRKVFVE